MRQRIISTLLLWAVVIGTIGFFGLHGGVWLISGLSLLTQWELYRLLAKMGLRPKVPLGLVCGAVIPLGGYYFGTLPSGAVNLDAGTDLFLVGTFVLSLLILSSPRSEGKIQAFLSTLIGIFYVPFLLHYFVRLILRCQIEGLPGQTTAFLAIWIIAVAKFTDVGALLIGLVFGRHQLAPQLSPKKTWEGSIGGVLTSALVGVLLLRLGEAYSPPGFTALKAALIAIPLAVSAIAADLIESAFKRAAQVKDSGNLIPGIGGAFDLMDSLILAGPLGYIFLKYFVL